ncbi:MAG TPA: hypothetical protein VIQ48_00890 [Rhodanobacter sp.]
MVSVTPFAKEGILSPKASPRLQMADNLKIVLNIDRSTEATVANRAKRLISTDMPISLGGVGTSIHFLRGVGSRSTFALASFYLLLGADIKGKNPCTIVGYSGKILQSQIHFASLNTIALACRKAFDHGKGLTGATFGRESDAVLEEHAKYWAENSNRPLEDASRALHFLRTLFAKCSKKPDALFKDGTTLGCRVGFLKQYADRSAAHLSLENYEFDPLDVAHVVAALTLVGSIICSFDNNTPPEYFNQIDEAAFNGAIALFPELPKIRLFEQMNVAEQAQAYWKEDEQFGLHMLIEQLPYAISWF